MRMKHLPPVNFDVFLLSLLYNDTVPTSYGFVVTVKPVIYSFVFGSRNIENMLFLIDYDLQIMQIISLRDEVSNQFKEWIKNISEHECYKKKNH